MVWSRARGAVEILPQDSSYMACGFYMPHSASIAGKDYLDYILSIDDLERKTGLVFFVNLPAQVGEENARKIKSQEPVSWWK